MATIRSKHVFVVSILFALTISIMYLTKPASNNEKLGILSPIPDFFKNTSYAETEGFWKPNVDSLYSTGIAKPVVTARTAISYDLTSEKLLYEKKINQRVPIASLTKVMTAIIALENMSHDQILTVSEAAATVGEDSMGLTVGETYTLEELLYGLFLHSGNDAAEVIAENSPYGRDNFVYLMNKKAEDMGLSDTHFTNPTGLEGDGNQYSTAIDLVAITRYGLLDPKFAEVSSTVTQYLPYSSSHKAIELFNETNLLTSYPGVKGIKTGFTYEAGMCLITYLEYKGHRIIAVLLNSDNRRQEMKDLLDYSLKTLGVKPPPHD